MSFNAPENVSETQDHFNFCQKQFLESKLIVWSLFLESEMIGTLSLEINKESGPWQYNKADIGYWLDPQYNQGFNDRSRKSRS